MLKLFTRSQKGQSLAFFVLLLPLLLIMPILLLELGHVYIYQSELQQAADAAALAGANNADDDELKEIVAKNANRTPFAPTFKRKEKVEDNFYVVVLEEGIEPIFVKVFGEKVFVTITASAAASITDKKLVPFE